MNHNPEKWFKHSIDSHNEPQMRRIKARFGKLNGYAMYYISIEIMMRSGGWIEHDDIETYADDYGVDCDELERFFSYCVSIEAFILVDNKYSADTVQETLEKRKRISEVRSEAGAIGGKAKAQAQSEPEQPALEKKPKKSKSEPASDAETDASRAVKGYVASLEAEIGTKISCTMSNVEAEKIGAKYGELTPLAIRVYYLWKTAKGKRVKSDYLSMLAPWVLEKAQDLAKSMPLKAEPPKPAKTPEEIALGEERRKMIMERAGFGK